MVSIAAMYWSSRRGLSSRSRGRVSDAITIRLICLIPLNRNRGVAQPGQSTAFGTQESLVQIQSPRFFSVVYATNRRVAPKFCHSVAMLGTWH
jgi:hypothetical protein